MLALFSPAFAQSNLSLTDAVRLGLERHPAVEASQANKNAAQNRFREAQSAYLPKVSYSESYYSSNNPVFVFGSLLNQGQFRQQNFDLKLLNNPNSVNNFQSKLSFGQTIYDFGSTKSAVRAAELGGMAAAEDERRVRMVIISSVAGAYFGAVLAKERLGVADEAVRSAEADLKRAETVRAAGMSTDADVLSIRVHLSEAKERQIQATYAVDVAGSALNDALGLPLDSAHELSTPLSAASLKQVEQDRLAKGAAESRPESREAALATEMAEAQSAGARSALFPVISAQAVIESDRGTFATRGGANWLAGLSLNWNLFSGFAAQSRKQETEQLARAARALQKRIDSQVQLEVRRAYADWRAAQERIGVAEAAVSMAAESLRITRNRYEAGLTTITELLRNETVYHETKTRHLEVIYQQRLAAAALELAAGTLSGDSDAIK